MELNDKAIEFLYKNKLKIVTTKEEIIGLMPGSTKGIKTITEVIK